MSRNRLNELLLKLRHELNNIETRDKSSEEALEKIKKEIENVLRDGSEGLTERHKSLLEKLGDFKENFEASHPELASAVNNVINFLNNLGL